MNRKLSLALRFIAPALIVFVVWLRVRTCFPGAAQDATPAIQAAGQTELQPGLTLQEREAIQGGHPLAAGLNARETTPQRDLEILRDLLQSLTTTLKVGSLPPLGDNEDITAALTGHNKRKLVVLPANHPSVDSEGRLLDRWGTPYHFHARSADTFDLRSAGPDKVLFTTDDVTNEHKYPKRS
jgi:hypothetical protein